MIGTFERSAPTRGFGPRAQSESLRRIALVALMAALAPVASCSSAPAVPDLGTGTFHVTVTSVNGSSTLPTASNPLPPNLGVTTENWGFTIEARTPTGDVATDFNGYVRLTVVPGTLLSVAGDGANGRNILLTNGQASGTASSTGVYGPAQLWIEDLGYVPAAPGTTPKCSNGIDDNDNGLIDYPADPGCYYADDDTEDGGSYNIGVSAPVPYALPKISDVRGKARTPFPNEAIEIAAASPQWLVVTRVGANGFFVTDISPGEVKNGYNSLFAYNFSTPSNMQVCDRIIQLGGTSNDFYGFTQLSFPSFVNTYSSAPFDPAVGVPGCMVPDPTVLSPSNSQIFSGNKDTTAAALYPLEASLVRLQGFTIAKYLGAALAINNNFGPNRSNCDFNGSGAIDYEYTEQNANCIAGQCEGDCANYCDLNPDCSEYTAYSSRGQYKVSYQGLTATQILINTTTVPAFDPTLHTGETIDTISGSLTEFSGGSLNWTVEARCPDDLVCAASMGCSTQSVIPTYKACVVARTVDDNDEGTN